MAGYRRRGIVRRRRFRGRRRIFRRRRPLRRRGKGTFYCKFTKSTTLEVPITSTSDWSASFVPSDFLEYTNLAAAFESIQFLKAKVRVLPCQNISNNSTSVVPSYCMLPWHRDSPPGSALTFNQFVSSDHAKIYRMTERGKQMYVPNTLVLADGQSDKEGTKEGHQIVWKPVIERAIASGKLPRIYCGLVAFQGISTLPAGTKAYFDIITDVWVKCKNQNILMV
ncbi:capsid protein [Calfel virus LSF31_cyc880]|uniref:Capsid protein n=1 Tax=Calfel virus LSF31_cyc880 TaxID=2951260 RepID=A0AAX3BPK4_9CIRC|nr:capsid protein [Calfel virus LSF31_cyc880]UUG66206.1 capsid protein [Calfel virus LSF31_cyc880]